MALNRRLYLFLSQKFTDASCARCKLQRAYILNRKKWEREKTTHPGEADFSRTPSKSGMELSKTHIIDPRLRGKKGSFKDQSLLTAGQGL